MIYAQLKAGQKLHLVNERGNGRVDLYALCGIGGDWRLTINLPMGMACKSCDRIFEARNGYQYQPKLNVTVSAGV